MPKLLNSIPSYRLHRQSGQAIVTLCGKDYLLGKHGTAESKREYDRRITEWIASGRHTPTPDAELTISELIQRYRVHAEAYYKEADGKPSREAENIRYALRPLRKMYGATPAQEFGPLALEAAREKMIEAEWSRKSINRQVDRIRQMFRWAVSKQLLPSSVYESLRALAGLRVGRSKAQESKPVQPIADEIVEDTLPHLSSVIRAMVQLQRLTGARPGEICSMKIGEIDRTNKDVWSYRPTEHKTQHHGHQRVIYIGSKAQEVIRPFLLKLDAAAHVFSPVESVAEMRQARTEARKTPASCGNKPGSNVKRKPKRTPKAFYDVNAYRRAIARGCKAACVESWHPHRLRHTAATQIRRQFGLEAAQHVLGHSTTAMTEVYAERNQDIARAVAAKIG